MKTTIDTTATWYMGKNRLLITSPVDTYISYSWDGGRETGCTTVEDFLRWATKGGAK